MGHEIEDLRRRLELLEAEPVTAAVAARRLGVSEAALRKRRQRGRLPDGVRALRVGRSLRWIVAGIGGPIVAEVRAAQAELGALAPAERAGRLHELLAELGARWAVSGREAREAAQGVVQAARELGVTLDAAAVVAALLEREVRS